MVLPYWQLPNFYGLVLGITMPYTESVGVKDMKERDTSILPVRIKKDLLAEVEDMVFKRGVSRNSWVIRAIKEGLRKHTRIER